MLIVYKKEICNGEIIVIKFQNIQNKKLFAFYVQPMVCVIKAFVPATMRSYNPNTHEWEISKDYWQTIEMALTLKGWTFYPFPITKAESVDHVKVDEDFSSNFYYTHTEPLGLAKDSKETAIPILSSFLGIKISTQPIEELKSLYRKKARELHPDLGGDAAKMSELNRAWNLYSKGV